MTFIKTFTPFFNRSSLPRDVAKALMSKTLSAGGDDPNPNGRPHKIEPFVKAKLKASFQHGAKSATTSTPKTREHFSPKKGK
jgi:hypothetical protein